VKNVLKLLFLGFLSISVLNASSVVSVFGLKDQDFAELEAGTLNRYKINDNLMISTNLGKTDKMDGYFFNSYRIAGFFEGKFKKPVLDNWAYTVDLFFDQSNVPLQKITFMDENGLTFDLKYRPFDPFIIKNKKFSRATQRTKIKIVFINGTVTYYVNDKKLNSVSQRFGKLKSFRQELSSESNIMLDMHLQKLEK